MADPTLTDALAGLNTSPSETSWGVGSQTLAAVLPRMIDPVYGNVGTNLGISLGGLLLQGLLSRQAKVEAAQETLDRVKAANQLVRFTTPEARTQFIEQQPIENIAPLSTLAQALTLNTLQEQQAIDKAKQVKLAELAITSSPEYLKNLRETEMIKAETQNLINKSNTLKEAQLWLSPEEQSLPYNEQLVLSAQRKSGAMAYGVTERDKQNAKNKQERDLFKAQLKQDYPNLSPTQATELAQRHEATNLAYSILDELPNISSWADLTATKSFSMFDQYALKSRLQNLGSKILLSRSGKAATDAERTILQQMSQGDFTAGPAQLANILKRFANDESQGAMDELTALKSSPTQLFNAFKMKLQSNQPVELGLNVLSPQPGNSLVAPKSNNQTDIDKLQEALKQPNVQANSVLKQKIEAKIQELKAAGK